MNRIIGNWQIDRVKERGEKKGKKKRKLRRKTIDLSTNAHPRSTQLSR